MDCRRYFHCMPPSWLSLPFVHDEAEADEPMGSKEKWWVDIPGDSRQWLLKLARLDERDGTVSGEDWAEWAVHHLAGLLGVPTAVVQPATLEGRRGIVSQSVLADKLEYLDHGNSVLSSKFPDYDQAVQGENRGYTPAAVEAALAGVAAPTEVELPAGFTAFDCWVGYLVLDAWVAGRDRHHENWAVVLRGEDRRLAASFDHGNALGFQERDERRARLLEDGEHLQRWLDRGTSRHFAGQPHLVALAHSALGLAGDGVQSFWMDRLEDIADADVHSIVDAIPNNIMTVVTRTFVVRLLTENKRRLLSGYSSS